MHSPFPSSAQGNELSASSQLALEAKDHRGAQHQLPFCKPEMLGLAGFSTSRNWSLQLQLRAAALHRCTDAAWTAPVVQADTPHGMPIPREEAALQAYHEFAAIVFLFPFLPTWLKLTPDTLPHATTEHLAKQCAIQQATAHRVRISTHKTLKHLSLSLQISPIYRDKRKVELAQNPYQDKRHQASNGPEQFHWNAGVP